MSKKEKKPAVKLSGSSIKRLLKFLFKDYPVALCVIGICIVTTSIIGILPSVYIKTITGYIQEGLASSFSSVQGKIVRNAKNYLLYCFKNAESEQGGRSKTAAYDFERAYD